MSSEVTKAINKAIRSLGGETQHGRTRVLVAKQAVLKVERQVKRAERENRKKVETLRAARELIDTVEKKPRKRSAKPRQTRPALTADAEKRQHEVAAGPAAITATRDMIQDLGRSTQAALARQTGLNTGNISHAVHALEAEGVIQRTGEVEGNSPVWAVAKSGSRGRG